MARLMFTFNDIAEREIFNDNFVPYQDDKTGEIVPPEMPDPRYNPIDLKEVPTVKWWKNKDTNNAPGKVEDSSGTQNDAENPSEIVPMEIQNIPQQDHPEIPSTPSTAFADDLFAADLEAMRLANNSNKL